MKGFLGIDIGTSKIALVVIDEGKKIFHSASLPTNAYGARTPGRAEQQVPLILSALEKVAKQVPQEAMKAVSAIGLTGQMHGVVLWNRAGDGSQTSPLFTWEDERCLEGGFLERLQGVTGDHSIRTGFGGATLAWLAEHEPATFGNYSKASTIHDFVAAALCEHATSFTDPSDAASWGFFDSSTRQWRVDAAKAARIPGTLLPEVRPMGSIVTRTKGAFTRSLGIPESVPVFVPIGDNQASLYGTISNPDGDIALTLGTGGQVSVVLNSFPGALELPPSVDIRPYFDGKYLAVAASLCGGSALRWLTTNLEGWFSDLKVSSIGEPQLFAHLDALAMAHLNSPLEVGSSFRGERHDPGRRGYISGIDYDNFSLGNLTAALGRSVIQNLRDMLPGAFFEGRSRVVGSGKALRRLRFLQAMTETIFEKPLVLVDDREEAAFGAALQAMR